MCNAAAAAAAAATAAAAAAVDDDDGVYTSIYHICYSSVFVTQRAK